MLGVLALALPGCRQAETPAKASDPSGTYTLATINGNKLPFTPPHEGGAPEVQSGAITLNADGTFTSTMAYRLPGGRDGSRDFSGVYTRSGAVFRLEWKGAGVTPATLETNTLTIDNEGMKCAYRKQAGEAGGVQAPR